MALKILTWLSRVAGIDFHVFSTLLSRGWSVIAGAPTLLLVPLWLTPTEQGYYYTFASLLGLQLLFELGLGQVTIQLVGQDAAYVNVARDGRLVGDERRIDHIAALVRWLRGWYRISALCFVLVAGGVGGLFLAKNGGLPLSEWLPVWGLMVFACGINLTFVPALAVQEGLGLIGQVARVRFVQSVIGYLGLWLALITNLSLWAACTLPVASALITSFWLRYNGRLYAFLVERSHGIDSPLDWRREVFPLQWRMALSALSGYLTSYTLTPIIFAHHGAAEAGRFGIAMAAFNALAIVGNSWIYAKTPIFTKQIAQGKREELNAMFRRAMTRSVLFTAAAAFTLVFALIVLDWIGLPQIKRFADTPVLVCLAIVCVANSCILSVASYMRAHREEPMMLPSLVGAALSVIIAYFGSMQSVLMMSALYACLTVAVLMPWALILFFRYYRR